MKITTSHNTMNNFSLKCQVVTYQCLYIAGCSFSSHSWNIDKNKHERNETLTTCTLIFQYVLFQMGVRQGSTWIYLWAKHICVLKFGMATKKASNLLRALQLPVSQNPSLIPFSHIPLGLHPLLTVYLLSPWHCSRKLMITTRFNPITPNTLLP